MVIFCTLDRLRTCDIILNMDIIVKKSKIHGKGVFANKNFKKGEVVLRWNPKKITKKKSEELSTKERHYLEYQNGQYLLMQPPERYVNHSCDANTKVKNQSDIAVKDIKKGEEITSNYNKKLPVSFNCKCGSRKCKIIL